MAIAYEQSRLTYGTGDTVNLAFTSNVKANSLLLVAITQYKEGGISTDTAVTDSQGNAYDKVGNRIVLSAGVSLELFYAFAGSSAACTVQTNPESASTSVAIHEFSGVATTNFIDQQDQNTATSALASGGAITTTNNNDLLFAVMTSSAWGGAAGEQIHLPYDLYSANVGSTTEYNGVVYYSLQNTNINHQPDISPTWWESHFIQLQEYEDGDLYSPINTMYKIVDSTLTETAYWTLGSSWQWAGWITAFKAAEESTTILGSTSWGQSTGTQEGNTRTFSGNWAGNGFVSGSGNSEKMYLSSTAYMESEVVNTGANPIDLYQNRYSNGDTGTLKYRSASSVADCQVATWQTYSGSFTSSGYTQVRVEGVNKWWLANGISAGDVVAAYAPMGATSAINSRINLANPGVYTAVLAGPEPWYSNTSGWGFDENAVYDTGITNLNNLFSVVCKYSDVSQPNIGTQSFFGVHDYSHGLSSGYVHYLYGEQHNHFQIFRVQGQGDQPIDTYPLTYDSGVRAIAGRFGYQDGILMYSAPEYVEWTNPSSLHFLIGCLDLIDDSPAQFSTFRVHSISIYNKVLTQFQIQTIGNAMP